MFIDKYKPLYSPDVDAGTEEPQIDAVVVDQVDEPEDTSSSLKSSVEKSLEKGIKEVRAADDAATARGKKAKTAAQPRRVAGGAEVEPVEAEEVAESTEETPEGDTPAETQTAAPEAFSKEAKAEWAKTPAAVQAAILKRETDTAKGVEELKNKYKDIDSALTPHIQAIRQNGHTPAQAVHQLFSWFQALAGNPDVAFPALAKSFGYDLAKFAPATATAAVETQPDAAAAAQPGAVVPPELQKYIDDMRKEVADLKNAMGQQLGEVKTTFQRESEAKTNEVLMNWAKDKPHFEKVRGLMAQFIQSGAVPLKEGQVDLDGAYDMAVFANPEVRTAVLAEQQAAAEKQRKDKAALDAKKATEAAAKARKAGSSLGGGAPGETAAPAKGKTKGKSVRESIMEAREQLTE